MYSLSQADANAKMKRCVRVINGSEGQANKEIYPEVSRPMMPLRKFDDLPANYIQLIQNFLIFA